MQSPSPDSMLKSGDANDGHLEVHDGPAEDLQSTTWPPPPPIWTVAESECNDSEEVSRTFPNSSSPGAHVFPPSSSIPPSPLGNSHTHHERVSIRPYMEAVFGPGYFSIPVANEGRWQRIWDWFKQWVKGLGQALEMYQ